MVVKDSQLEAGMISGPRRHGGYFIYLGNQWHSLLGSAIHNSLQSLVGIL